MGLQTLSLVMIILLSCVLTTPVVDQSQSHSQQCRRQCGEQTVPYPFGISGDSDQCFRNSFYELLCNTTYNPPKLFLRTSVNDLPILNISEHSSTAIVQLPAAVVCYNESGQRSSYQYSEIYLDGDRTFTVSTNLNKFTVIGCYISGTISGLGDQVVGHSCYLSCERNLGPQNTTKILDPQNFTPILGPQNITQLDKPCPETFIGCCQTEIPRSSSSILISLLSAVPVLEGNDNDSETRIRKDLFASNPCSYGYLAVAPDFRLKMSPEKDLYSEVALDWVIRGKCEKATSGEGVSYQSNCGQNTLCTNYYNGPGYQCYCNQGYEGNPYINCTDINECVNENVCKQGTCKNTPGNYTCQCPFGYHGDGKVGCRFSTLNKTLLGIGGSLLPAILIAYQCLMHEKKIKEKNLRNNGGLLLKQLSLKNFKETVLLKATNNFDDQQVLGEGGNGWVYKGSVEGMIDIAVKKSKILDQNQIEQFLNEADVVSKINHKNVVKLLGVCLETKVPMLVYEFVPNGTLSKHIHDASTSILSSWKICLKIVAEIAHALDYMHSQADPPIIHRDVKPSNVLLDQTYTAKVADFGASKLIRLDHTVATTKGQGTMGYFDPEYFQTGELTTKSDVYGFGVVLMELLTKRKPISQGKYGEMISIVHIFASAVEENQLDQVLNVAVANEGENEQVHLVAKLAVKCVARSSNDRPTMTEVADVLNRLRKEYISTSEVVGSCDSGEVVSMVDDQDFVRKKVQFEAEQSSSQ